MEQVNLVAQVREGIGRQNVKHLRQEGLIPAVIYKRGEKNVLLQIGKKDLFKILHTSFGENVVISLKIDSGSEAASKKTKSQDAKTVIIKETQKDPLRNEILHVDFQEVSLTESIKVNVPIIVIGESVGVKRDGGLLEHLLWEIEVECLPTNIPEKIEVDISALEIGHSVHVKDLKIPAGVNVLSDAERIVISVTAPMEEEVVEKVEEEVSEPEVIKQKKPEAEEETPEKEKKQEKKQEEKK